MGNSHDCPGIHRRCLVLKCVSAVTFFFAAQHVNPVACCHCQTSSFLLIGTHLHVRCQHRSVRHQHMPGRLVAQVLANEVVAPVRMAFVRETSVA